jgi:hypothetical protein
VKVPDVLILLILLNVALNNAVSRIQVLGNSAVDNSYTAKYFI